MSKKLPPLTRHAVTAPTEDQGTRLAGARLLPLHLIEPNPWQPRQHADPERMQELIEDIKARGILEPIIVRPTGDGKYQVVAGERRFRASGAAGLTVVPAIVKESLTEEEAREISLVENLAREDLDIEDEARFIKALYEQKRSLRATADAIHKSYQYVNRRLKLLDDPGTLLAYREGKVRLDDLIAGRSQTGDDLPMDEVAVTGRNSEGLEEVRFYRTRSAYKPFHRLHLHVRRLDVGGLPAEERTRIRQVVHDLIAELTSLENALVEDDHPTAPYDVARPPAPL
jgi:ParB/RepB/Spo0J family partition protein